MFHCHMLGLRHISFLFISMGSWTSSVVKVIIMKCTNNKLISIMIILGFRV